MNKSVPVEHVPPMVITYEEGQDPKYRVLPKGVSSITTMSTQDDTGGLQVLEEGTEVEKAVVVATQSKAPTTEELIEIEDDPELQDVVQDDPQVINLNVVETIQAVEVKLKADQDPLVDVQ